MQKAKRATIQLGDRELEVFQLPDGSYWLSQTQVAESVGKPEFSFRRFSDSKWLKALPGMGSDSGHFEQIQREGESGAPIRGVPVVVASAYWLKEAIAKNKQALALTWACVNETLTRRADLAFGIKRSESEYAAAANELLTIVRDQDQVLQLLEESYATDDAARETAAIAWAEVKRLQELLEENGIAHSSGE
ncbi:MAG: hypothetical protein AAGF75_00455 [Cyanobacteria bacterium P01_H01_bin.130]